ncbi:UMTA methyltransferase family protein [Aspergillus flavus]|uniref:UMTA methyltransferase family protein n=1 Tax=Aspergillus flavus (strain ATCC 200026 / FGSC A1120 / IAM 13836 / NRRL 3357 / JCM 12722 / SRRC 167) TaxID=332952 RepID=A0A7U2QYA1_ASPFN|nr:UMTA methyltransferase family protein [Aspergillus flavus]
MALIMPEQDQPSRSLQPYANTAGEIPIDEELSIYNETLQSDTTSLASSVLNYEYENGRRYHKYGQAQYIMPNDEAEQDRLDLVHHMFSVMLNGELFLAPVENPQTILDLGTGTGIWAIDVADQFPSAKVIGNDLSPIQPSWVPPNVEFVVDDFEDVWMHDRNYFDYVHARTISGCVQDWGRLMKQAYDHLKPSGYFECAEFVIDAFSDDGTFKQDSPYREYINNLNKAGEITGRPMNVATSLKTWMKNAGFENVTEVVYVIPYGPWPKDPKLKEIGKWQYVQAPEGVEAYGLRLYTQVLGWPESEAKLHQALVKQQLRDKSLHIYGKLCVVRQFSLTIPLQVILLLTVAQDMWSMVGSLEGNERKKSGARCLESM